MLFEYNVWHLLYENGAECMMLVNYTGRRSAEYQKGYFYV